MKRLALAVALLALMPASAFAQQGVPRVVTHFADNGNPHIQVALQGHTLEDLRRCPPGGAACEPITLLASPSGGYEAGETAAGTVFEADLKSPAGVITTERSVPWQGRVTATSEPTLAGEAKVGGTVTVVDAAWSGGWGDRPGWRAGELIRDQSETRVIACRTPQRTECWVLVQGPLAQRWAGWYLFAASWRLDGETYGEPVASTLYWPFANPAWMPVAQTRSYSSAPVQVCCTLPAPAADATPAPTATLRARAVRSNGRLLLGRVDCTLRCTVGLTVSGGGRTLKRTFTVEGTKALSIPRRRGRLSVRVRVDGKLLKTGRVTTR